MAIPKTLKERSNIDFLDRSCRTDNRKRKKDYYCDSFDGDFWLWIDHMGWDNSTGCYNDIPFDFLETIQERYSKAINTDQLPSIRDQFREFLIKDCIPEGYWEQLCMDNELE